LPWRPRCPAADLFGIKGRAWLGGQDLPADERAAAAALLRQLDFRARELALIDAGLARVALGHKDVRGLMTIPGVDATVALSIVAAVGDFTRFRTPDKLVSYLGLNPRVRQSGGQPASHGRITKAGPAHAREMLVEAAWSASKAPGPLRAFYHRVRARRGMQVAAVATARKLTVLCWHLIIKGEGYAFALPSPIATSSASLNCAPGRHPPAGATATPPPIRWPRSAPPNATWPPRAKRPTAPWSPPGSPPDPRARRRRAQPPATGRDSSSPQAKQRGKTSSPIVLLFARRSAAAGAARPPLRNHGLG
jgi:hypothetical protein